MAVNSLWRNFLKSLCIRTACLSQRKSVRKTRQDWPITACDCLEPRLLLTVESINTDTFPSWTVDREYADAHQTIDLTTSGTTDLVYSEYTLGGCGDHLPTLPAGLNLDSHTGEISGTTQYAGDYQVEVHVDDLVDGSSVSKLISLRINPAPTLAKNFPTALTGQPYDRAVVNDGTPDYAFTVSNGNLPEGFSFDAATGHLQGGASGVTAAPGTYTFDLDVTDAAGATVARSYSLAVAAPVSLQSSALSSWTQDRDYGTSHKISVVADSGVAPFTFSRTAGSLPAGLTLESDGTVDGTPSEAGDFTFTVQVRDSSGFGLKPPKADYTLHINSPVSITSTTLGNWAQNVTGYSQTVHVSDGTGPFTFAVTSGDLPAGLVLDASTGVISGTPTAVESQQFDIQVTDSTGSTAAHNYEVAITEPFAFLAPSILDWTVNRSGYVAYQALFGGTGTLTYSVTSGTLPDGLSLDSSTGEITGTPTTQGASTFTLQVQDAAGVQISQSFTLTINPPVSIAATTLANWTIGASGYSQSLSTNGTGTGPFLYDLSAGSLPAGLDLDFAGNITGTPTATGASTFTVHVVDIAGSEASRQFTISVNSAVSITTTSLSGWTENCSGYSQTLAASGGTGAITYSIVQGILPPDLSLNASTGAITGTPTLAGTAVFTVEAKDAAGAIDSTELAIPIQAPVSLLTTSLPGWTIGQSGYSQPLSTSGGTTPLTYNVVSGTLPSGLSLNASTGLLTGTPTTAGTSTFTVRVSDVAGSTAAKQLTVSIAGAISISTSSLAAWTRNQSAYSQTIASSGGTGTRTYTLSSGTLPAGLTVNASTGAITGTPTTAGTASFTVKVQDVTGAAATRALTLTVNPSLSVTASTLADWTQSQAGYNQSVTIGGGTSPNTFAVSSGVLPAGLSLNSSTGAIAGTPTTTGTATFTIRASDATGATTSRQFTVVVNAPLTVTTTTLAAWTQNQTGYSQILSFVGGTGTKTFSTSAGTLPPGLSLNASTGAITGTPTATGTASLTVKVQDAAGASDTENLTMTVNPPVSITTSSLAAWTANISGYSQTLAASGGTGTRTYSISLGALPAGLTLNASTGAITGTPSTAGTGSFTVKVQDLAGAAAIRSLTLAVNPPLSAMAATLVDWTQDQGGYNQSVTTGGGTIPYTFAVSSGVLPAGLALNSGTGVITGTPTTAGTATLTLRAIDSAGATTTGQFTVVINPPLTITTTTLSAWTQNQTGYSRILSFVGGTGTRTFSTSAGTLPAGLSLNASTGAITGTPTATGTASLTVKVQDAAGASDTENLTLTVNPPVSITTASLPAWTAGISGYSQTLAASGGTGTRTYSITQGDLPAGLTLNRNTGAITGTPSTTGTASFTIQAQDETGAYDTRLFTLSVNGLVSITSTSLRNWTRGQSGYSQAIQTSGGTAPFTFNLSFGNSLPAGLTLNTSSGVISGTPTGGNTSTFTIRAQDAAGALATRQFTVNIASPISLTTTSLPDWTQNTFFSKFMSTSGGTAPLTYSIQSGSLPAGLSLNSSTGAITGSPSVAGSTSFTIQAQDSVGAVQAKPYSMTVNSRLSMSFGDIWGSVERVDWTRNVPFTRTPQVGGGTGAFTFSISSASLPVGLTLDTTTGTISGTPSNIQPSWPIQFTLQVRDQVGAVKSSVISFYVNDPPAFIPSWIPPDWTKSQSGYATTVGTIISSKTLPWTYSVVAGSLPSGLSLDTSTGAITGTPTTAVASTFTVAVVDAAGASDSKQFDIQINGPMSITTQTLNNAAKGFSYSGQIGVSGGTPLSRNSSDYHFSKIAGGLPAGLSFHSTTGVITGTPITLGTSTFTILVVDAAGVSLTKQLTLSVAPGISITTTTLPAWTQSITGYSASIATTSGTSPLTFSVAGGALPSGLTMNASTGVIQGTPTVAGTASFTILAKDSRGSTDTHALTLTVNTPLSISTTALSGWDQGLTGYSQALSTTGGTGSRTFWVSAGSLPAGLSLNILKGVISGSPASASTTSFTVKAVDSLGSADTQAITVTIQPPATLTTTAVKPWTANQSGYSQSLSTTGGSSPFTFSVSAGSLPAGLTLTPTGIITGAPATAGTYSFTLQAQDAYGQIDTQPLSMTIYPALQITSTALSDWTVGRPGYSDAVDKTGGIGPYTFRVVSGSLPAGMSLSSTSGAITGNPIAEATSIFTISVQDSTGATDTQAITFAVNPLPTITTSLVSVWDQGLAFNQPLSASGGTGSKTFSVVAGSLPAGLSLASGTGVISGTPTAKQISTFTLNVADVTGATATRTYVLTTNAAVSITTATFGGWTVNRTGYAVSVAAVGGRAPYQFSLSAGSLPAGMTLNSTTGGISGVPTPTGTASFTITARDTLGGSDSQAGTIAISPAVSIATNTLPSWTRGAAHYTQSIALAGGTAPYSFSVISGGLPAGLSLAGGSISGTPTSAGLASFTVKVVDATGASNTKALTLTINPSVTVTAATLPNWEQFVTGFSQTLSASGGTGTKTFELASGSLPAGLTLNSGTGVIAGTPSVAGTFTLNMNAIDSVGGIGSRTFTLTVIPTVSLTSASLPDWTVNRSGYKHTIPTTGGTAPYTFSVVSGSLPAGLSLASTGAISGVPSTTGTASATIKVRDSLGQTDTQVMTMVINAPVTITTTALSSWTAGLSGFSRSISTAGGTGSLAFGLSGGVLPGGLTLSGSGLISGTPTVSGSFQFTVKVSEIAGTTDTQILTLQINPPLLITTATISSWDVGAGYNQDLSTSGGTGAATFSISAGVLPTGLSFNKTTGVISGVPTTTGTFAFTVMATDTLGAIDTQGYSVTINPAMSITTSALSAWTAGQSGYSQQIHTSGGTGPLQFSTVSGGLPGGLSLNSSTGIISGTPSAAGTSSFTLKVLDHAGVFQTHAFSITINPTLSITATSLPGWTQNRSGYGATIGRTGGTGTFTYAVSSGSLPAGLSLNSTTGAIAGTPTTAGTSSLTIRLVDSTGATDTQGLTLTVNPPLSITTTGLPNWDVGISGYSQTVSQTGGTGTKTYSVSSGSLPAGLVLSASTGEISGTPTTKGVASFTITVKDQTGASAARAYSILVASLPTITTTGLPNAKLGSSYLNTVVVADGSTPFAFSISSGTLPLGLSINASTGVIGGTPAKVGLFSFTVKVIDRAGASTTKALQIRVTT